MVRERLTERACEHKESHDLWKKLQMGTDGSRKQIIPCQLVIVQAENYQAKAFPRFMVTYSGHDPCRDVRVQSMHMHNISLN